MPCDSVITNSVNLGKLHRGLLEKALGVLGFDLDGGYITGTLDGYKFSASIVGENLESQNMKQSSLENLRNAIKVGYSKQVLGLAAQKFGWSAKTTGTNQYVLERR